MAEFTPGGDTQHARQNDPFAPLRHDVDLLARALGVTIRELEGDALFNLVEQVRSITKRIRDGDTDAAQELRILIAGLDLNRAEKLLRAFTIYFQLTNLAEEIHRVRVNRARDVQATLEHPRGESLLDAVKQLKAQGWTRERAAKLLASLDVTPTLTAHPTEVKRYTVRLKLERIASAMRALHERQLSPQQRDMELDAIHAEIATLWQTRELLTEKPTVLDEVKSALYYYERSLLDAVPRLQRDLEDALDAVYGPAAGSTALPPVLRLRSWIGGDRDGNPNVTPEVTREAFRLQADVATAAFVRDVDAMVQRLSQTEERVTLTPQFRDAMHERESAWGPPDRFAGEPFRQWLFYVHARLLDARARLVAGESRPGYPGGDGGYAADLERLLDTLRRGQGGRSADAFVRPAWQRARAFGFELAPLDLREHSKVHERVVADLLRAGGVHDAYETLPEADRVELLAGELASSRPFVAGREGLTEETRHALGFLDVFKWAQREMGEAATGSYIISMTEGASDVLEVLMLAKQAGVMALDATPLFETQADLEAAPNVLATLFNLPAYRAHVEARGVQEVMIGYSDSNKDAGFLTANWALYGAQQGIAEACQTAGVPLRLFHGRGTSIGRGGGPAGRAILAQPPGTLHGRMRLTEQGEAMADRYTDPDLAYRHLEQVMHAFVLSSARDATGAPDLDPAFAQALQEASLRASETYRALLEAPGFLDFYADVTPIEEIARLNVGSRPTRRKGDRSLSNLRAIPWVFSWTQTRANLPGWFGLGSGLQTVADDDLKRMYAEWPFLTTVIDFARMSLLKSDMTVFERYLDLTTQALKDRFWPVIRDEHALSVARVEAATGEPLAGGETFDRSVRLRNPYVDPINHLQVELIARLRALPPESPDREAVGRAVLLSLLGVSAGMRNTG
jgi:phosphoenolpyruvate carboxylase